MRKIVERSLLSFAAVVLSGSAAVQAADIPNNTKTKAKLIVNAPMIEGRFERRNDSDWYKIRLEKDRTYAVIVEYGEDCCQSNVVRVRDANGKVLGIAYDSTGDYPGGLEFRPKKSGVYFLEYQEEWFSTGGADYGARITGDCPAKFYTTCQLKLGELRVGTFAFVDDRDGFKMTLDGTKLYTVTIEDEASTDYENSISILDSASKRIASVAGRNLTFSVPKAGTYYAIVGGFGVGQEYRLALTGAE